MTNALITGITGQDGLYLAETLIDKGYNVIGVVRNINVASDKLPLTLLNQVHLYQWDMLDMDCLVKALEQFNINEIYNLAAFSSGQGMYDDPIGMGEINGLAVIRLLEAIRRTDITIKLCQASSSEMFGAAEIFPQNERTAFHPRSPYGAAKLYAHNMIDIFRKRYGVFACSAILYNHESPRRGQEFVTKKIIREAVRIKLGLSNCLCLGNLDAYRDWGFAGDYVQAMWLMLQNFQPDDYIVATGELHTVREFCEYAFSYLGLDYHDYVQVDPALYRPNESVQLVGDTTKIKNTLRWRPKVGFFELIKMMVDEEVQKFEKKHE